MTQREIAGRGGRHRDGLRVPAHGFIREPELLFHPDRVADRHAHPLAGLATFGPYSGATLSRVANPIRVAVIAPHGGVRAVEGLLQDLERVHQPRERKAYLRDYPGFSALFDVRLVTAEGARIEIAAAFSEQLADSPAPHLLLAERLSRAVQALEQRRDQFDVLLIYLPDRWSAGFWGPADDDFDLHDYLKAITAVRDIPTQLINENKDGALAYYCRCSVGWRLGIALYCKAGGVPWKLASTDPGVAHIGVSYALRGQPGGGRGGARKGGGASGRFVTCCSQVFDADGTGLDFLAYSPAEFTVDDGRNPFLSRDEMRRVMARSLDMYQRRHSGAAPRRVVVHKTTEFREEEIDGCFDAFRVAEEVELLQVQQDTPWQGIAVQAPRRAGERGEVAGYPVLRGSYLPLGQRETLLWTQGNAPEAVGGRDFFKEGKGVPTPLLIRRFAGHGPWDVPCRELLGLTKMNWNSDSLYDRLPVTLAFASTLARVIGRMDQLGDRAFPFRLFM